MSTEEQLTLRALRIMSDGRKHDLRVWGWAHRKVAAWDKRERRRSELQPSGFTLRELSLASTAQGVMQ